jgi:hypothetical protein
MDSAKLEPSGRIILIAFHLKSRTARVGDACWNAFARELTHCME